jgi:hypothetical protein
VYKSRSAITYLFALILFLSATVNSAASGAGQALPAAAEAGLLPGTVQVTLSAAETTTSWDSRRPSPQPFQLPLLTLHQQQRATEARERTLTIQVAGLSGGTPVELEIRSWHEHPVTGAQQQVRGRATLPNQSCTAAAPCTLSWTLDAATMFSDFCRLALRDGDGDLLWQNPDPQQPDFVALDTWEIDIRPYTVRINYGVLFPFARGEQHLDERLAPQAVHAWIGEQFVPIVLEAWRTQFGPWGFGPIHPRWDADRVVEVFFTCPPYALFDGMGTHTISTYKDGSPYPERRIWLLSNDEVLGRYDALENGFKIVFSHEFFHLAQWNVRLSAGQTAPRWTNVIVEAQAIAASSIQYPELELSRGHLSSTSSQYSGSALRYLEKRLETSYTDLEAEEIHRYDAALYWRFLYERYGDMRVFRSALEELARRPAAETAASLDAIMDAALGRVKGPFESYEASLAAFARANAALLLEEGRCAAQGLAACGERYYDPHRMYTTPLWEAMLYYQGAALDYAGTIPASYGTDLIQMSLDGDLEGTSLAVAFRSEGARFHVEVWKLHMDEAGPRNPARGLTGLHAMTPRPEVLSGDCSAACTYTIQNLDRAQFDRLMLIIVRLDPYEDQDPLGAYQLTVGPAR